MNSLAPKAPSRLFDNAGYTESFNREFDAQLAEHAIYSENETLDGVMVATPTGAALPVRFARRA